MIDNNTNNNKKEIGQQIVNDADTVKSGYHAKRSCGYKNIPLQQVLCRENNNPLSLARQRHRLKTVVTEDFFLTTTTTNLNNSHRLTYSTLIDYC